MIIVTTGPNLFSKGAVSELCKKGLEAIRIPSSKQPPLEQINKILPELSSNVKIIVDFPGGKFRMNNPDNFQVKKGEILKLGKQETTYNTQKLAVYPNIKCRMDIGDILIVGDGETALSVIDENYQEITTKVERDAVLAPRRGITIKNKDLKAVILTPNDYEKLDCLSEKIISGIMLSFVEEAEDIKKIKDYLLNKYGRLPEIYAKIETEKGIENLEVITAEADYIVLARGDLLISTGEEQFPVLQQKFLEKMRFACSNTIIATELAHSVGNSYLMSRSELTFLYLIGRMGYKNLLLTSETASLCDPVLVFEKVSKLIEYYSSMAKEGPPLSSGEEP